jgi:hypothetical protein
MKVYVWVCATMRKIAVGCFYVLLVHTIEDIDLLELKEEALDLMFHSISLV